MEILSSKFINQKIAVERHLLPTPYTLNIDPNQIKQALINVLLNAVEAMQNGGKIIISSQITPRKYYSIEIEDTGVGIPREELSRIFDPYFSRKDHGTGLGLSITQSLIQNHKGIIQIKSRIRTGTTVRIDLPL